MKLLVTQYYSNTFEIEVDDDATDEEITDIIIAEDDDLGGDWDYE